MTGSAWTLFFHWPQGGVWSNMVASILWTAPAWIMATFAWRRRKCAAAWFCHRLGQHEVAGTLVRVCSKHHDLAHHEAVHAKHGPAHRASGRLDFGQSHGRVTPE